MDDNKPVIVPFSLLNAVIEQLDEIERNSGVHIRVLRNALYLEGRAEMLKAAKEELKNTMRQLSKKEPPRLDLSIKVNDIDFQKYPPKALTQIFPTVWSFLY